MDGILGRHSKRRGFFIPPAVIGWNSHGAVVMSLAADVMMSLAGVMMSQIGSGDYDVTRWVQ